MKFAIISDTHFGDNTCTLVKKSGQKKIRIVKGDKFDAFVEAAGTGNKYLVMAGDIFDFSIAPYEEAYAYGRAFFRWVRDKGIADEIIYIAGNHDADLWHIIQHQRSVINRIKNKKMPKPFAHSVAGIIDDRKNSPTAGFWLNKVKARTTGESKYGNMFLDHIAGDGNPIPFNFAYPNLYIATDTDTVMVTHGQYLEPYWSLVGELGAKTLYDDLKIGEMDMEELVELNFPLNQLACTGLGQAGCLTPVLRQVELEAKAGNVARLEKYLGRLNKELDRMLEYGWIKEYICDRLLKEGQAQILEAVRKLKNTRYMEEFIHKPEVKKRFADFYNASLLEIAAINEEPQQFGGACFNLQAPERIIFGHTHQPVAWDAPDAPKLNMISSVLPKRLRLFNTGGWLTEGGKFCGAEVFTYETGTGFASTRIN